MPVSLRTLQQGRKEETKAVKLRFEACWGGGCADVNFAPVSVTLAGPTSVVGSVSVYTVSNVTVPLKDPFDCLQTQVLLWAVLEPQALGLYTCPQIPVVISAVYCHQ